MGENPFIFIEGGQIEAASEIWTKICYGLNYPEEIEKTSKGGAKAGVTAGISHVFSVNASVTGGTEDKKKYKIDSMDSAIRHLSEHKIALVVDDFHYLPQQVRTKFLRNIKGPVFNGLKLVLLSVTHRGLDAVKAERELEGRVHSVVAPEWDQSDLVQIAEQGFSALNLNCPKKLIIRVAQESHGSPFLMQQMCWEVCAGLGVDSRPEKTVTIKDDYDLLPICVRLSKDSPIYKKLELGPQSRKARQKRKLKAGGTADIYKVILMAIAATGPTSTIGYDDLRTQMNKILSEGMPQKNEITAALKHLSQISREMGNDAGIDWDSDERKIDISDPYLRFYLRWQVRPITELPPLHQFQNTLRRIYFHRRRR